jgi:hypothetical protein
MDTGNWGNGDAQRKAARRFMAVQDRIFKLHGHVEDLRAFVAAHHPELLPALDGLPCVGIS